MEYDKLIIGAIAFLTGVVVATLQFLYTRRIELQKQRDGLKIQSYVDFIKGVNGIGIAQKWKDTHKEQEYTALLADAKARITIYGCGDTVAAIADFYVNGADLSNEDARHRLIKIVESMRRDFKNEALSSIELYKVLYHSIPQAS